MAETRSLHPERPHRSRSRSGGHRRKRSRRPEAPETPASRTQARVALFVLVVLHAVGLVGLNWDRFRPDFEQLVWINLLFTFSIVMSLHSRWNTDYATFVGAVFSWGMLTEILGVKTGFPFGNYHYGPLLGQQLAGVPLVIGLNWVVLTYATGAVAKRVDPSPVLRVVIGALLLVGLDALIEPFAIRYGMWTWADGTPPLRNYIGWFGVGLLAHVAYVRWAAKAENPVAGPTFFILLLFFAGDRLVHLFG
jgi:uncharacterized membrane protein